MSLNEIYKKINTISPKVELSQVEIQLGAIDVWVDTYKKTAAKISGIKSRLISSNDELGMTISELESLPQVGDKLIAQMKDLGITQELKNVEAVNSSIKGLVKSLNSVYKNVSNESKKI